MLTDPPYHDDVHYGELSLPLQAWAGLAAVDATGDAVVNRATGQLVATGSVDVRTPLGSYEVPFNKRGTITLMGAR